jgi:hypothetical protein
VKSKTIENTALRKFFRQLCCVSKKVSQTKTLARAAMVPQKTMLVSGPFRGRMSNNDSPGVVFTHVYKPKPNAPKIMAKMNNEFDVSKWPEEISMQKIKPAIITSVQPIHLILRILFTITPEQFARCALPNFQ